MRCGFADATGRQRLLFILLKVSQNLGLNRTNVRVLTGVFTKFTVSHAKREWGKPPRPRCIAKNQLNVFFQLQFIPNLMSLGWTIFPDDSDQCYYFLDFLDSEPEGFQKLW
ncbi:MULTISPECIES: hypothetical protein [unclassified Moorena]|uniref:hypothetical protein n=1 Tax=unclassified Moorena TaxID=2683338 RepID=UPI00140113A5|nr:MULTISPECIES: hypothetical protein [unclassified Moorena]NEO11315.1 hypothetical protein [Moorena sp. SIO3E8]NEP97867.1 hypothetical protein [Moorena sp. SIO3F7]